MQPVRVYGTGRLWMQCAQPTLEFGEGKAKPMPRQCLTFNLCLCLIHVSFYPLITWGATTQQIRLVSGLRFGWPPALNFPAL